MKNDRTAKSQAIHTKHTPVKKNVPPGKQVKPPVRFNRANLYFVLAFLIFAAILYGNTIWNRYAIDDNLVASNEVVKQGFKAFPEIFSSRYYTRQGNIGSASSEYRPIVKATFAVEHQLWGEKPGRSHIINILLYWAISVLLFFVLKRLLRQYNILFPFLVTLLFMAHPLHTEVVASLKNRDELLAFLCGLGTLWSMLRYADRQKIRYILLAAGLFFIGYLSKSAILPFLVLIPLALYFFTGMPARRLALVFLVILAAVAAAQWIPRLYLPPRQLTNSFIENPLFLEKSAGIRLGTGFASLLFYLKMMVFPYPLLYYYGYDMIPLRSITSLWPLVSFLLHAGLFLFAVKKFREKSFLSFAILWYLVAIAMYSNILFPVVGIVGERFAFNASLGFCLAVAYLIFILFRTDPRSLTIEMDARLKILAVVILLLVPSTVLSITRNRTWKNLFTLYRHDIKYLDNSAKANIDYAGFLMNSVYKDPNFLRSGSINQLKYFYIVTHFRRSLELYPDNYLTLNDLGTVYLFMGKNYDSAVYFLDKAIRLDSTLQPAWVNLGMAYRELKQYDKALACYEHILRVNPNQVKAVFAMANVYNDMGEFDHAVAMNEEMAKKFPQSEMPYVNIGNYYMMRKDTLTAVNYWERAASINPTYELCVQLNSLYLLKKDEEKATYYYNLGLKISQQSQ